MRPSATSVGGLKLLVHETLSYWCMPVPSLADFAGEGGMGAGGRGRGVGEVIGHVFYFEVVIGTSAPLDAAYREVWPAVYVSV